MKETELKRENGLRKTIPTDNAKLEKEIEHGRKRFIVFRESQEQLDSFRQMREGSEVLVGPGTRINILRGGDEVTVPAFAHLKS